MINCRQATRLYSDGQERKLSLKEGIGLKMHCMMCAGCQNFGKQINTLREISRSYAKGLSSANDD